MFDGKLTIDAPDAGKYRNVQVPVLDSIWASVQDRQGEFGATEGPGKSNVSEPPILSQSYNKRSPPPTESIRKCPRKDFDIVGLYNSQRASKAEHTRDLQSRLNEKEGNIRR